MEAKEKSCGLHETMYHVTYKDNVDDILKRGLIPQIGKNSKFAGEPAEMVYLCDRKDVGYWLFVLNADIVLEVEDVDKDDCSSYEYAFYSEFLYRWDIEPEQIRVVDIKPTKEQIKKLCFHYLGRANIACQHIAEYYSDAYRYSLDTINDEISQVLDKLKRLDFSDVTDEEIAAFMRFSTEETPNTMCDEYYRGGDRLWEMLVQFPKDETFENRKALHDWIKDTVSGGLYVDTGTYGV